MINDPLTLPPMADSTSAQPNPPLPRWRSILLHGWLLLCLAGFALIPALTQPIERIGHDAGAEHIYRGVIFSNAISSGVLYPRWVQHLHLGLGGPLFTFQGPLPFYAMDLLYRLGIPHPLGWRLLMASALFVGAVGMAALVRAVTCQRWPSLVAAVAFVYAPYVIQNVFDRGSNEAYSMLLYPAVLWALLWLARGPTAFRFAVATLLWSLCIGVHVLGPLMFAPVVSLTALVLAWRYRAIATLGVLLAGGLLTAFIWAPILDEMDYVRLSQVREIGEAQPANNPIPLDTLLSPPVLFDTARVNNTAREQAGLLHALALLLAMPATLLAWRQGRRGLALFLGGMMLVGGFVFWLLTPYGTPAWHLLSPVMHIFQYRFRLMSVLALASASLVGAVLAVLPRRARHIASAGFMALLILSAIPSLYVNLMQTHASFGTRLTLAEVREAERKSGGTAFTVYSETNPRWRELPIDDQTATEVAASPLHNAPPTVSLESSRLSTSDWDLDITAAEPATLTLHLLYYPRWQAFVNGEPAPLTPEPQSGLAQLSLPAGRSHLALRYTRTGAEWAGIVISALTFLFLIGAVLRQLRRQEPAATLRLPAAPTFASPPLWLLLALPGLLAFKTFYVDQHTNWFRCASTASTVCGAQQSVMVEFVGGPTLRGYSVPTRAVSPGDIFVMRVMWQGKPGIQQNLSSFVHIRNSQPDWPTNPRSGNDIWAQQDQITPGGSFTKDYKPDGLYWDEFRVAIPQDIPPGEYLLEIGWYNPATSEQLDLVPETVHPPLHTSWRSILLPSITIR